MRTTKFIKGDRVKIVANLAGHQFGIGQEVVIAEAKTDDNKAIDDKGNYWWIDDNDGEIIKPAAKRQGDQINAELLEALVDILRFSSVGGLETKIHARAKEAIKKAGGQS